MIGTRFAGVEAELERDDLSGFLQRLRELPPAAVHSSALDHYWTKAAQVLLTDPAGELIEGAARRYLTGLRLVESITPYIVWSRGSRRMLHLRAKETDERTLCGVPILSDWVGQAERGAFTAALEGNPLSRDQKPCRRCAKSSSTSLGRETPRYEVLSARTRAEMLAAGTGALKGFVIRGDWWSDSGISSNDHLQAKSAARDGAMIVLRREAGALAFARGPEWLVDNWLDGYYLRAPVTEAYGEVPLPDAAFLASGLQMPKEGEVMWQGQALGHAALSHLVPRVAVAYWPEAIERLLAGFESYRTRPFAVTRIQKAAEEAGLLSRA